MLRIRVFPQWKIEAGGTGQRSRWVGKFPETPFPVISSHTGVAGPVERNPANHHMEAYFVDAATAILLGGHDALCPFFVPGEQV